MLTGVLACALLIHTALLTPDVYAHSMWAMCRRLTGLAGGYVLVELGLHLSFEFTGQYGGVWWPFVLAHQARARHEL